MQKIIFAAAGIALSLSGAAWAQGDAAAGEKTFKKCKACHMIADGDDVIVKGGKTGPNLYGVIGRAAGAVEGFRYSKSLLAAGEAGLVWTEETLARFITDPKGFLREETGDPAAKSKMTFKLTKGSEDVAAYLASLAPMMDETEDGNETGSSD